MPAHADVPARSGDRHAVLIDEPTEPPEALVRLGRLPPGRPIPGVAVLLADRRRRWPFPTHDGQLGTAARAVGFAVRGVADGDESAPGVR